MSKDVVEIYGKARNLNSPFYAPQTVANVKWARRWRLGLSIGGAAALVGGALVWWTLNAVTFLAALNVVGWIVGIAAGLGFLYWVVANSIDAFGVLSEAKEWGVKDE